MALRGVKVLEMAGLAPVPMCGMVLSDFGADVIRIDRAGGGALNYDVTARGKRSIALNVKHDKGRAIVRDMAAKADVILEPFRPGVMEKLGLGPNDLMTPENPGLIYARLTGFGQSGPYKDMAGHDINYLALSGVLSKLGRPDPATPHAPVNLLADFAGGSFVCAMGIMAALLERAKSGRGQVIDSSMVEGAAYVSSWLFKSQDMFVWQGGKGRGGNFLDGGSAFYDTYRTKDGKFMAVGALEPHFFAKMSNILSEQGCLETGEELEQFSGEDLRNQLTRIFSSKDQSEWAEIFDGTDACVTPVVDTQQAHSHPHNVARSSFVKDPRSSKYSPVPAPKLSRTPAVPSSSPDPSVGQHSVQVLEEIGYSKETINQLLDSKVIFQEKAAL